jgi:endonuclease YncB( thermonuclease family)
VRQKNIWFRIVYPHEIDGWKAWSHGASPEDVGSGDKEANAGSGDKEAIDDMKQRYDPPAPFAARLSPMIPVRISAEGANRRRARLWIGSCALLMLLFTASALAADLPSEVSGPAAVEDGDTLMVGRAEVRLFGIDAPEMSSGHGHFARAELEDLISGQEVRCKVRDRDRYKRLVAVCRTDRMPDLAAALLAAGEAITYRQFLRGAPEEAAYLAAESLARSRAVGLWSRQ